MTTMIDGPGMTREQLDQIADQIAGLSRRVDVTQHLLLTHLRAFDAHDGWAGSGFLTVFAWLAWRIDIGMTTARMLACDCSRVDVAISESGEILDVGRARRTIPSAIGRALWLRDGGCRVPGCGRSHHLHAHHIEAWAEGGKTSTSNLVLLCPSHHTLFVEIIDGRIAFRNVHGMQLRPGPDRGEGHESIDPWLLHAEPEFDQDGTPQWDGSRLDVDEVLSWMLIAEQNHGLARAA
jgi:hypothetical protein